jgi:hypothetical protein
MKNFRTAISNWIIRILIVLILPTTSYSKPISTIRKFLYPLHFNLNIGYGLNYYTLYTQKLIPFEKDGNLYLYNTNEKGASAYLFRSFGSPYVRVQLYESQSFWEAFQKGLSASSYKGMGSAIPIVLSGYIDILKKFRLELGSSLSINFIKRLEPIEKLKDRVPPLIDGTGRHYVLKFFLMPGFKLFENYAYTLLVNTQIAYSLLYGDFINDKQAAMIGLPFLPVAGGFTFEKHISEYLSLYGRALYENANHVYNLSSSKNDTSITLNTQSFYLQLGVSAHPAEMPRCPIPNCEITTKHKHDDTAYRGSSWIKGRNLMGKRLYDK